MKKTTKAQKAKSLKLGRKRAAYEKSRRGRKPTFGVKPAGTADANAAV